MFFNSATKMTSVELLKLIEEAKNAELCRNIPASQQILRTVWSDIENEPNFDGCEPLIKAELLRLSGSFLSFYGKTKNQKNYQIRGKNLLTNAIDIFENEHLPDKVAEAKVMLAFCYWHAGEISECEAILEVVEAEFDGNQLHPVFLQIKVNRLMTMIYRKLTEPAVRIIQEMEIPFEFCKDNRLKAMFHNQAGVVFDLTKDFFRSIHHLKEAIRFGKKCNNFYLVGINYNNLAMLHKQMGDYPRAHEAIEQAMSIFHENGYQGFIPDCLDTKALIYLCENRVDDALAVIDIAVEDLQQGEDYASLTNTMWTRVCCLLRADRKTEAFRLYGDIISLASQYIDEVACSRFADAMANEVYVPKNLPLLEEVRQFRKSRVRAALIVIGNNIVEAAKYLRLDRHQTLSNMLKFQFPELYDELGITRRNSPTPTAAAKLKKTKISKKKNAPPPENLSYHERDVSCVDIPREIITFNFPLRARDFKTYYFSQAMMKSFAIETDAIVAVVPVKKIKTDIPVLVAADNAFYLGRSQYDSQLDFHFVLDERRQPVILDKSNVIGVPVGHCSVEEAADAETVRFDELHFQD